MRRVCTLEEEEEVKLSEEEEEENRRKLDCEIIIIIIIKTSSSSPSIEGKAGVKETRNGKRRGEKNKNKTPCLIERKKEKKTLLALTAIEKKHLRR